MFGASVMFVTVPPLIVDAPTVWTPGAVITVAGVVLSALAAAIVSIIVAVKQGAQTHKLDQQADQLEEVHVLVNSRLTAVLDRVTQLTAAMSEAEVDIPVDPNP